MSRGKGDSYKWIIIKTNMAVNSYVQYLTTLGISNNNTSFVFLTRIYVRAAPPSAPAFAPKAAGQFVP